MYTDYTSGKLQDIVDSDEETHMLFRASVSKDNMSLLAAKRREIIVNQLFLHASDYLRGRVLDFGGGGGNIAYLLEKKLHLFGNQNVEIFLTDIADFRHNEGTRVPFLPTEKLSDNLFETTYLSVCCHHFTDLETNLKLITDVTQDYLIVIEAIPKDNTQDAIEYVWGIDYLTNRIMGGNFYIPMSGGYGSTSYWTTVFGSYGWKEREIILLPMGDQLTLGDIQHTIMIFSR